MRALAGSAAAGIGATLLSSLALASVAGAVTVPTVSVPQPVKPPVQLPSLPQVQPPKITQPSTPSTGGGGSGGGGGNGSVVPTPPSGGLPSVPLPNFGGGGGGSGSNPSGGGGSGSPSSGGGASGGSGGGASEHRLQNSAKELRGCLGSISGFERRVLVMRAGLGARARSRAETARQLGTSSRRVARAERSSVRRLRSAVRNGECATAHTVGASITDAGLLAAVSPSSQTANSKPNQKVDQSGVLGVSQSSDETKDGEPILGAPAGSSSPAPADQSGPIVLLWGIGALILGLGTVGLLRRRRMTHAGPLDVPSSELPPAPWASRDD